jgi:polysaccharide export outer membrane protein
MRSTLAAIFLFVACASAAWAESGYVYQMGAGDRLKIVTYGEEKLTGEFVVSGEGVVAFPLVGDVPARGRTVADFRADLVARLSREFLRNPSVTVDVVNFRPVYVLGEVAKPGEFPFAENMTVYTLVAKAGGFTYRANRRTVFIRREGQPVETAHMLSGTTVVRPGDTIRIGERYF